MQGISSEKRLGKIWYNRVIVQMERKNTYEMHGTAERRRRFDDLPGYGCGTIRRRRGNGPDGYYGQKHAKEIQAARQVAAHYGVAHKETNLSQAFA